MDHVFSARIIGETPYKTRVNRSGPVPWRSREGGVSNWKILLGMVLLKCTAESRAAMDQLTWKGKQKGRYFFKSFKCVNPSFSLQHYYYFFKLNFDFLLLGLKKAFTLSHSVL